MMNELLRMANELMTLERDRQGGWPCHGEYPCMYTDDVITVIKGYQDLIRRMADMLEACSSYGHGLWCQKLDALVYEAWGAIPQEQSNE